MKIVIAPDSFKESLDAPTACRAIERGVRRVDPHADIDLVPMADGGEGTVAALVTATGGSFRESTVSGPLGGPVVARWGLLGGEPQRAAIEMAAASGLALVPADRRDPTQTTTLGTGELIRAALDVGVRKICIGIGGSATTDGGTGMAQAIGVRFLDARGGELAQPLSGGMLPRIARLSIDARDARIAETSIVIACDVDNPLCGPRGAAAVYGPQKGATPEQVALLDAGLSHLADVIERDLGRDIRTIPGSGAAGGLGAGLIAFAGADLRPGVDLVMDAVRFRDRIAGADLIITGEGRLDAQSMMGKVIAGVGRAGKAAGVPVVALAGTIGNGAEATRDVLAGYHGINPPDIGPADAFARAEEFLEATTVAVLKKGCWG